MSKYLNKEFLNKHRERLVSLYHERPFKAAILVVVVLILANYFFIQSDSENRILERQADSNFQNGRILNDSEKTFYNGKEKLLSQKAQSLIDSQEKLEARLKELEEKLNEKHTFTQQEPVSGTVPEQVESKLELYPAINENGAVASTPIKSSKDSRAVLTKKNARGSSIIAFPVKKAGRGQSIVLPAGSYVKAKIMTGVDVPEGKTYPVLMVLDFSYIAPNDFKVDLKGCFMIAKAEGDLSTERVQMQATKLSCVSRNGKMFEREVNGFVADDTDGSFAMQGKVQSKQGRVATMAFMSSVVEGVGKAVQATQTSQSTNAFGGTQSSVTGDQEKYLIAGGAANAASMVAQWYLKQAQNLAPTVSVNSGRDVWIVMKDKVALPPEYFSKKGDGNESYINSIFNTSE